jgi:hypothetical protein
MTTDPQKLYRFLALPGIEVAGLVFASDDVVGASWRCIAEEKGPTLRHTNEVIGVSVTAGARIHLYEYLDRLQHRALDCDIDTVIFIEPYDQPALIETGDCLGAMTSELKPGLHIDEFVSAGPKNYAYRPANPTTGERETVCNVRGIPLNYSASKLVNFDVIRDMILRADESEKVMVHHRKIKQKRAGGRIDIITEPEGKMSGSLF